MIGRVPNNDDEGVDEGGEIEEEDVGAEYVVGGDDEYEGERGEAGDKEEADDEGADEAGDEEEEAEADEYDDKVELEGVDEEESGDIDVNEDDGAADETDDCKFYESVSCYQEFHAKSKKE
ncbi:hypothetical protein BPAE_0133g00100 [Botrytis paeoniae]|uniref:Uncharacterized protein n=1 Tax=Botrytis paeoniae TaxID=278948 RepID=A0A4Z1FKT5_9HELO|nr:hypothetical protein BPAE_0133g00100 [Botrytis paeoniae]